MEEPGKEAAQRAMVSDILLDLRTGRDLDRRAAVRDADAVQHYVSRFDALFHAPECVDITQELLAAFAGWLEFARPWDVYLLKTWCLKPELLPCWAHSP